MRCRRAAVAADALVDHQSSQATAHYSHQNDLDILYQLIIRLPARPPYFGLIHASLSLTPACGRASGSASWSVGNSVLTKRSEHGPILKLLLGFSAIRKRAAKEGERVIFAGETAPPRPQGRLGVGVGRRESRYSIHGNTRVDWHNIDS